VLAVAGCGLLTPDVGRSRRVPPDTEGPGRPRSASATDPPGRRAVTGVPRQPPSRAGPACRRTCATTTVVRVIDGDTLVLRGMGRVRLIGVDAPETWLRHDCFGAEATRALSQLTPPGSPVRMAGDSEPHDRYGRRLLYLWTPGGVLVNAALVHAGFARAMSIPPNTSHAAAIRAAEATARHRRSGLWRTNLTGCVPARRSSGGR